LVFSVVNCTSRLSVRVDESQVPPTLGPPLPVSVTGPSLPVPYPAPPPEPPLPEQVVLLLNPLETEQKAAVVFVPTTWRNPREIMAARLIRMAYSSIP
jgi:hypothetical protein